MYSILFHISGIAIIEISFYFLYIGPIESIIFKRKIRQLLHNPEQSVYRMINNSILVKKSSQSLLRKIIEETLSTDYDKISLQNYLYNQKLKGQYDITKQNNQLFIQALIYWAYFTAFSIFVYVVHYKYNQYMKLKKKNGVTLMNSDEEYIYENATEIELMEMQLYRKSSIDDDQLETYKPKGRWCDKSKICNVIHYIIFGGCLLAFQLCFFETIVSKYEPLSNGELMYIIYEEFKPSLDVIGIH